MAEGKSTLLELTDSKRKTEDWKVDIVFVHGLTGDSKGTWRHADGCFWPEDLLPDDIPEARVFSFGYRANITTFWSPASHAEIDDHADRLRHDLLGRRTQSPTRPIIFVAHSLGGLLCEEAILKAKRTSTAPQDSFADCTHGIMFFATPHGGSEKANWAHIGIRICMLLGQTDSAILEDLENNSGRLVKLGDEFRRWILDRSKTKGGQVNVMCFFEQANTHLGPKPIGQVVTKEEAILPGGHSSIPIDADHVGICKCKDRDDSTYQLVLGLLRKWIKDLDKEEETTPKKESGFISNANWHGSNNYGGLQTATYNAGGGSMSFTSTSPRNNEKE